MNCSTRLLIEIWFISLVQLIMFFCYLPVLPLHHWLPLYICFGLIECFFFFVTHRSRTILQLFSFVVAWWNISNASCRPFIFRYCRSVFVLGGFFFSFAPIFFPTWPPYPRFPRPFLALTALFIPCLSFHSLILRFSYPFFFGSIHGFAFKSATEIELLPNHTDWTNHTQNIRIQLNYYRIKMMKCICHTPFHLRFTIPIIY